MEVRRNLRDGISKQKPEIYILSHNFALFCGFKVKIRLNYLLLFHHQIKAENVH